MSILISSLGALLKYELHAVGHKDASVLVSMTPAEWEALQNAVKAAPESDLQKVATAAIAAANVVKQTNGTVAVQLAAGDYSKVSEAHAAAKPPEEKPADKPAETAAAPAAPDPRDARIAELEAKLAEAGKKTSEPEKKGSESAPADIA